MSLPSFSIYLQSGPLFCCYLVHQFPLAFSLPRKVIRAILVSTLLPCILFFNPPFNHYPKQTSLPPPSPSCIRTCIPCPLILQNQISFYFLKNSSPTHILTNTRDSQSPSSTPTTTLTVTPHCVAAPTDVIVTRSNVAVPSCAGGANETKPVIVSMSGMSSGMAATATMSGGSAMFTGAAARVNANVGAGMMGVGVFGGLVVALMG